MKKILFLGPVTNIEKGLVGGATISYGYLTDYFLSKGWPIRVVNTKQYLGSLAGLKNALFLFLKLCQFGLWADIIFLNSSRGGTKYLAPLVYFVSRVFRAKFVFRPFGGDIKDYTRNYSQISRWIFNRTILKADILYLQTQELMDFYAKQRANTKQLRTSRKKPKEILISSDKAFSKRFIYLGFVNGSKGIDHLLQAKKILGDKYTIHIYGPIKEEKYQSMPSDIYKGVLNASDVLSTLSTYDVLILPTFYEGEGYPGAIIEAYSMGLPVIATNWKAIPEIIIHGSTGLLIETHSSEALVEAIKKIDHKNYNWYSENALRHFNDTFAEEIVLGQVKKDILEL